MKRSLLLFLSIAICVGMTFSCAQARPPKPGPNFVWIAPHKNPRGYAVPGHWKYVGPRHPKKVWVPGHRAPNGNWISGHWRNVGKKRPGSKWIPGHFGPGGKWIPGHWR